MKRSFEQFENPYMKIMGISAEDTLCINDVHIRPQPLKFILHKDPYEGCVTIPFIQRKETVKNDLFIIDKILLSTIENEIQSLDSDKEELDKKELKIIDAIVVEPINKFHTYACSECSYTTNHSPRMHSHKKTHAALKNPKQKGFHCKICDYLTIQKRVFKEHQDMHARKEELIIKKNFYSPPHKKYICPIGECGSGMTTKKSMNRHLKTQHNTSLAMLAMSAVASAMADDPNLRA